MNASLTARIKRALKRGWSGKIDDLDAAHAETIERIKAAAAERDRLRAQLLDIEVVDDADVAAKRFEIEGLEIEIERLTRAADRMSRTLAERREREAADAAIARAREAVERIPTLTARYQQLRAELDLAKAAVVRAVSDYRDGLRLASGEDHAGRPRGPDRREEIPPFPKLGRTIEDIIGRPLDLPKRPREPEAAPRITPNGIVYPPSWTPERIQAWRRSDEGRQHAALSEEDQQRRAGRERDEHAMNEQREKRISKLTATEEKMADVDRQLFPSLHGE